MKSHYTGKGVEAGPTLKMTFAGEEIKLDIPDVGITLPSGWSLQPLQHPVVKSGMDFMNVLNLFIFRFSSCYLPLHSL